MRIAILVITVLSFHYSLFAEGTQTLSHVKTEDVSRSYLDISKIEISKEKEGNADREKEVVCFTINGVYKITDTNDLIILLFEMIKELKKNP